VAGLRVGDLTYTRMNLYRLILKKSGGMALLALLAGLVSGISGAGLIALINKILQSQGDRLTYVASFATLCSVVLLTRIASGVISIRFGQKTIFDLRLELSRRILSAPLARLEEVGTHRLMSSLTEDVAVINNSIISIPIYFTNIATVAFCLAYLGWLSWPVLLIALGVALVGAFSHNLATRRAIKSMKSAREQQDSLFKHFQALIEGAKELRLNADRRKVFIGALRVTAASFRRHILVGTGIYSAASSWAQTLYFILIGVLLFFGPRLDFISAGSLTGCVLIILYMRGSLEALMGIFPALGRTNIALKRLEEMKVMLAAGSDDSEPAPIRRGWQRLELVNATHIYRKDDDERGFVLGPINALFRPGEIVFLIGGNGSGKTTFIKLLTGLYAPEQGEVLLDNRLITDTDREAYSQYFSVVFSDSYLFDSLLGLAAVGLDARAGDYLVKLQLDQKVQIKDGKLSTTKLSQGQRKRLALLTAYLEDRPIYIFDEWAADQDTVFKAVFYNQFLPELKAQGKAVLVISHDDHYYHIADRIIKLDCGKIEYDKQADDALLASLSTQALGRRSTFAD
jgi:putative pyoverdin transport system ATP-binding/permease protein